MWQKDYYFEQQVQLKKVVFFIVIAVKTSKLTTGSVVLKKLNNLLNYRLFFFTKNYTLTVRKHLK